MDEQLVTIGQEGTPEGGVIRLMRWPEGYVLWHNGEIVWRSWASEMVADCETLNLVITADTSHLEATTARCAEELRQFARAFCDAGRRRL